MMLTGSLGRLQRMDNDGGDTGRLQVESEDQYAPEPYFDDEADAHKVSEDGVDNFTPAVREMMKKWAQLGWRLELAESRLTTSIAQDVRSHEGKRRGRARCQEGERRERDVWSLIPFSLTGAPDFEGLLCITHAFTAVTVRHRAAQDLLREWSRSLVVISRESVRLDQSTRSHHSARLATKPLHQRRCQAQKWRKQRSHG